MNIEKGKEYKVKNGIEYLEEKYGKDLTIVIEDEDKVVFGNHWFMCNIGIPAIGLFAIRTMGKDMRPAYYGKIKGLEELVYPEELEEIKEALNAKG